MTLRCVLIRQRLELFRHQSHTPHVLGMALLPETARDQRHCEQWRAGGAGVITMHKLLNDPKHWHNRAEEARIRAEQISDPEASRMMLEIAVSYERLARKAEERSRGDALLKGTQC